MATEEKTITVQAVIGESLTEQIDDLAREQGRTRSNMLAQLIRVGYQQSTRYVIGSEPDDEQERRTR